MKRKLILDHDTGTDDAIAIITAFLSKKFDILGICTSPLLPIDKVTENTLGVLELIGADCEVYQGVSTPLVKLLSPIRKSRMIFNKPMIVGGKKVMMHRPFDLPLGNRKKNDLDAASFYIQTLKNTKEKITIVITGLCSNLALALTMDDSIKEYIDEIIIMGGGYLVSNITKAAESNFFRDPEAAQMLLNSGCKITLMPLDATHQASFSLKDTERLRNINSSISEFVCSVIDERYLVYKTTQPIESEDGYLVPLHDVLCIAYLVEPSIIKQFRNCHCDVECSDGICDGKMNVDNRAFCDNPNVNLALKVNREQFVQFIYDAVNSWRKDEKSYI